MWSKLKNLDKDELLETLGLQSRPSAAEVWLPAIGLLGVGLLVGAGVGLLLAPKSGAQLREDLKKRFQRFPAPGQFPLASSTQTQDSQAV